MVRGRRGQVLVIAALAIALTLLSTQAYVYQLSRLEASSPYSSLGDYILGVEQGSKHVVVASLIGEEGGWLPGWGKRVKLTVDQNDVDNNLTSFPILVYLSNSSGRNGDDVSFVFDELHDDGNRSKIAITTADGTTQCYVEIESWDDANEEAWLWVRVPRMNSVADTELYLYYDADHADNTVYVGDPNSTPAEVVWDNEFRLVTHMRDDPDTSHVRDSTENDNDGTKTAPGEPVVTTSGNMSDAQDFDGSDDYVDLGSDTSLDLRSTDFTVEAWIYPTTQTVRWPTIYVVGVWELSFGIGQDSNPDKLEVWVDDRDSYASDGNVNYNEWNYVVLSWNGSHYNFYIDGETSGSRSGSSYPDTGTTYIGGTPPNEGESCIAGIIDEVRTSNMSRSTSWIKASFESGRDDMISYGSEETREEYFNEASTALSQVLERWCAFVAGDYRFGRCNLNATPCSRAPYLGGFCIEWGSMGTGVSSTSSDFTLNLSGRGAECDWGFEVNATTTALLAGSYQQVGGEKKVTVFLNVLNEGEPALAASVAVSYRVDGGPWEDAGLLYDYGWLDYRNGTYVYSFTVGAQAGEIVCVRSEVYDCREIYVRTEITPT